MKEKRKIKWDRMMEKIDGLGDKLGRGIDPGIKELVAAAMANKFVSESSCEGHAKWGRIYPWIDFFEKEPKNWKKLKFLSKRFKEVSRKRNLTALKEEKRMSLLLDNFYRRRKTPVKIRLTVEMHGYGFELKSIQAELIELLPLKKRLVLLKKYQKEMRDFGKFLKEKFLAG